MCNNILLANVFLAHRKNLLEWFRKAIIQTMVAGFVECVTPISLSPFRGSLFSYYNSNQRMRTVLLKSVILQHTSSCQATVLCSCMLPVGGPQSPETCGSWCVVILLWFNPYPTAFPYGNGMVLHFYQQQESSMTKTVHKVINKGLKTYV